MDTGSTWFDGLGMPPLIASAVEVVLVTIALIVVLWLLRKTTLRIRARSPRVQVSSVEQADVKTDNNGDVDTAWASSLLREELSALRLSATDALPEGASSRPLIEIIEGVGEGVGDKSKLGNALGRLARTVIPMTAYEVSATFRSTANRRGTISVQVVDHRRGGRSLVAATTSEGSWPECAKEAAATVAGALYPAVADRHKGPWTHWREPVPADLVLLHGKARTLEGENRLEQAMGAYHDTLDRDPLNPTLRLRIAMLQERMGLELGAWATYRAIADEEHRDAWKGADRRVRLLALYRLAILLGTRGLVDSWLGHANQDPAEREHRQELHDGLSTDRLLIRTSPWQRALPIAHVFPARFTTTSPSRLLVDLGRGRGLPTEGSNRTEKRQLQWSKWAAAQFPLPLDESERTSRTFRTDQAKMRIQSLLEILSLTRIEQLDARLRRRPPWRPWRWRGWWRYRSPVRQILRRREFSLTAIRVSKLVARIRIARSAKARHAHDELGHLRAVRARERLLRRWPFAPNAVRLPFRWLRPRQRIADRRSDAWQFHYNAACAVAEVLPSNLTPSLPRGKEETELVDAGIKQLEEYVHRAGSGQVWKQAEWVGHEDEDLAPLRGTGEYRQWSRHHLPKKSTGEASTRALYLDTAWTAVRIAHTSARAFAAAWRKRHDRLDADNNSVATWWDNERSAWHALDQILTDHKSWQIRRSGMDTLQACLQTDGEPTSTVSIDATQPPGNQRPTPTLSTAYVTLLGGLTRQDGNGTVRSWAECRARESRRSRGRQRLRSGHQRNERREALRAFRIWNLLAEALEKELRNQGGKTPGNHLHGSIEQIRATVPNRDPSLWARRAQTARWPNFSRMRW